MEPPFKPGDTLLIMNPSLLSIQSTPAHSDPPFQPGDKLVCVDVFGWRCLLLGELYTCKQCFPCAMPWGWEIDVEEFDARKHSTEYIRSDAFEPTGPAIRADDPDTYEDETD